MSGIWVYADNYENLLQLLTAGKILADKMESKLTALMTGDDSTAQDIISRGADEVILLPPLADNQPVQDYVPIIADEACDADPDTILISASFLGKEMAARIAARLDTGLCSECNALNIGDDGKLQVERLLYGGSAVQTLSFLSRPQMATIPTGGYEASPVMDGRKGIIRMLKSPQPSGIEVIEKKEKTNTSGDISAAQVIVCAGRGIENEEDMAMINELAELLGGEVGCTRPISEEKHWLSEESCIGLSAKIVKPDLYIGVGVSGQIQHLVGIREAGVICAINSDDNAAIFESSDYGINGDLYQVLPALIEELKK